MFAIFGANSKAFLFINFPGFFFTIFSQKIYIYKYFNLKMYFYCEPSFKCISFLFFPGELHYTFSREIICSTCKSIYIPCYVVYSVNRFHQKNNGMQQFSFYTSLHKLPLDLFLFSFSKAMLNLYKYYNLQSFLRNEYFFILHLPYKNLLFQTS